MSYELTWMSELLVGSGFTVIEQPGWETRGHADVGSTLGVLCHHTAGPPTGDAPSLGTVENGRPDLSGPLAQIVLARSGTVYLVAAGLCYHAGNGEWQGITAGNTHFIGIEAENTGLSNDPWPEGQLDVYAKLCATILDHIKAPVIMCAGHKEYALPKGRKSDPSFDMDEFRKRVASYMQEQH